MAKLPGLHNLIDFSEGTASRAILDRAVQGDPEAMGELRVLLADHPEVWSSCGDLARRAEDATLNLYTGTNAFIREAITREFGKLKAELEGPAPSPLEKLLAGRIALDWLLLHLADMVALPGGVADRSGGPSDHFREKTRQLAHRRYLQAIKTLADVRRLLRPRVSPLDVARMAETGGQADPLLVRRRGSMPRPVKSGPVAGG